MCDKLASYLLGLSRSRKRLLALIFDGGICAWTVWAAIYLRVGEWTWPVGSHWLATILAVMLALPIFIRTGLYRYIFRHTGWQAMLAIARACLIYGVLYSLFFTFIGIDGVPRTVGVIQPVLLFVATTATRAAAHYLLGVNYRRIVRDEMIPNVMIYGAGASGRQLAAALQASGQMKVVGFLEDDKSLHNGLLNGVPIYSSSRISELVPLLEVTDVLLAVPSASRRRRQDILAMLQPTGVTIRTLPGLLDLARGTLQISDIRTLQIEDLLGRDPVEPNETLLSKNVTDKVVLVTGAGGSIGSELCRQIFSLQPSSLLLVEASEFALYSIHHELASLAVGSAERVRLVPLLASVQDEQRLNAILEKFRPHTVYHAAAYKHVPLVEYNCLEALKNNVLGTMVAARTAQTHGVSDFVLISTDKAVRPTNVMGASKRLAEMVIQALADAGSTPRFSIVRFGNVLGSSGSVVPLFRQQIAEGGPITLTHLEVTRYFMTIPEAAQLVLQAGAMAEGGDVFVLDMGEPVLLKDLALNMIQLSGLIVRDDANPDGDIEIKVVGLRPGEKLHEELLIGENPLLTTHKRIMRANEGYLALGELTPQLDELGAMLRLNDVEGALLKLRQLVPEYKSRGSSVDHLSGLHANGEKSGGSILTLAAPGR